MIEYGAPPAYDEQEIVLFGPGYGEAAAIHLGDGHWLLVDSCLDPDSSEPAAHSYLQHCGVDPDRVVAIVASHWHDDHVRGIARLATLYPAAEFFLSGVFENRELLAFVATYSGTHAMRLSSGTSELYKVLQMRKVKPALQRVVVSEVMTRSGSVVVRAFSPTSEAFTYMTTEVAKRLSLSPGAPIGHATSLGPNMSAVVLHIDFEDDAILLGSDLEDLRGLGWTAVLAERWCTNKTRASVYKVGHHGSITAHHPDIWVSLLRERPLACLTPFVRGRIRLPREEDVQRLKSLANPVLTSSAASKKPQMDREQLDRLRDMCEGLATVNPGFGAVAIRRKVGTAEWRHTLYGDARAL